jgi:glycosyltransferase involved in cell wall biosynthesis
LRIVHVCPEFYPSVGGIEGEVYHVSRRLVERGHSVTVITSNLVNSRPEKLPKEETIDGVKVLRFCVRSPYPISKLVFTPSIITGSSAMIVDIFHIFSFLPYFLTNYISLHAIRKGIPLAVTPIYHPDRQNAYKGMVPFVTRNLYDRWIGLKILKRANYVMALVPSEAAYYLRQGIKNVCVRWTGIDEEVECSAEDLEAFAKRYEVTENTVLSLSRIERRKGIQHIIEAMPLILCQYPDTKLLVAGADHSYRDYLAALSQRVRCERSITFCGNLNRGQVACAFKVSKIFLLPSYYEILPRAIMEAWIYKKPVIASDVGGHKDLVSPETGVLIRPGDHEAIAEAVIQLLSDPGRASAMGENGHRLVKEKFTWDKVVDKTEEVYKSIVSNKIEGNI